MLMYGFLDTIIVDFMIQTDGVCWVQSRSCRFFRISCEQRTGSASPLSEPSSHVAKSYGLTALPYVVIPYYPLHQQRPSPS